MSYAGGWNDATKAKLKATSGWLSNTNGTDAYGFAALPGGYNTPSSSHPVNAGYWWSTAEGNPDYAWRLYITDGTFSMINDYKNYHDSVRCLKD